MNVKDVMLLASQHLGIEDQLQNDLNVRPGADGSSLKILLQCFNVVENELALDYLPLYCEDEVESQTGKIFFSNLSRTAVRILRVRGEGGRKVEYQLFPSYISIPEQGKFTVAYTYAPNEKGVLDTSDYALQASERLIALGMCVEYCLRSGLYQEANVWDVKYKDALKAAYRAQPSKIIRSRRWA